MADVKKGEVCFRVAQLEDLPRVRELFRQTLGHAVEEKTITSSLTRFRGVYVAEVIKEVVGYLIAWEKDPDTLWVDYLGIDPKVRLGGIGVAMMRSCEQLAARAGYKRIQLGVARTNESAICFYEKIGYERVREVLEPGGKAIHSYWYEAPLPAQSERADRRKLFGRFSMRRPLEALAIAVRVGVLGAASLTDQRRGEG